MLQMKLVANATALARGDHAQHGGDVAQIAVVVRVFEICLKGIVVRIVDTERRLDFFEAHGFQGQKGHHPVQVMGQRLIGTDSNPLAPFHAALDQRCRYHLLRKRQPHLNFPFFIRDRPVSVVKRALPQRCL